MAMTDRRNFIGGLALGAAAGLTGRATAAETPGTVSHLDKFFCNGGIRET